MGASGSLLNPSGWCWRDLHQAGCYDVEPRGDLWPPGTTARGQVEYAMAKKKNPLEPCV